jgi:hypothetical protein
MRFIYNDGGRSAAGYTGDAGDCVVRAIAIAAELPYQDVYDSINQLAKLEKRGKRKRGISSARSGVYRNTYDRYLRSIGWQWTPTMLIGSGCKVHLTDGELPMGRLIVSVSRHMTAVIDGVIYDTHDPQREPTEVFSGELITDADGTRRNKVVGMTGGRCVYGYWRKG